MKAAQIGCSDSFFVTPNGLDATAAYTAQDGSVQERGHGTTARDLALIMSYCVLRSPRGKRFLPSQELPSYSFCNKVPAEGDTGTVYGRCQKFSCTNHNAYLQMDGGRSVWEDRHLRGRVLLWELSKARGAPSPWRF